MAKLAPKVASLLGTSASALLESSAEAGGTYEQAKSMGKSDSEAMTDSNQVFFTNLPVNFILDKWMFNKLPEGQKITSAIKGSGQEAAQEAIQQIVSNAALNDEVFTKENLEGTAESALIGGIVGGGIGAGKAGIETLQERQVNKSQEPIDDAQESVDTEPVAEPPLYEEFKINNVEDIPINDISIMYESINKATPGSRGVGGGTRSTFPDWNKGRGKSETIPILKKIKEGKPLTETQKEKMLSIWDDYSNSEDYLYSKYLKSEDLEGALSEIPDNELSPLAIDNFDVLRYHINDSSRDGFVEEYSDEEIKNAINKLQASRGFSKAIEPSKEDVESESATRKEDRGESSSQEGGVRQSQDQTPEPLESISKTKDLFNAAKRLNKKYMTSGGLLPEDVKESSIKRRGAMAAEIQQMKFTLSDFQRISKDLALTGEESQLANSALRGEANLEGRLEPLNETINAMRDHIDLLSKQMIESGAVQGDLAGVIDKNMGVYVTRAYQVHNDPKWAKKVPEDVRNRARAYLRQELDESLSDQEIEGELNRLLNKQETSPFTPLGGKEGSKALGILKKRKSIPKEIRELWGEYQDVESNYAKSIQNMANIVVNHQFLSEIKNAGMGNYFYETPVVNENGDYSYEVAAKGSQTYSPLNGIYTSKDIKEALEGLNDINNMPGFLRHYMKVIGSAKFSKTVLNQVTHIRNFTSNIGFVVAQGNVNPVNFKQSLQFTGAKLFNMKNKEYRDYVLEAIRLGVVDESINTGELRDILRDASNMDSEAFLDNRLGKTIKGVSELYQAEDNFWKIFAFENEKAKYRKSFPEWSDNEVNQKAAQNVRNTMPTYSMVPESIKKLRRFPLVGTFVSFPSEVIRTGANNLSLIQEEMSNPQTRKIGMQRLIGTGAVIMGTSAIAKATMMMTGIGKEDDEDIREFVAPWQKNSQLAYLSSDKENAEYGIIDLSFTDPYTLLKKPFIAFMNGEDFKSSVVNSVLELTGPFVSEDMVTEKFIDIARNTNKQGVPIYNPQDGGGKIALDVTSHLWKSLEPGAMSSFKRVYRSFTDDNVNNYGRKYDSDTELLAALGGVRVTTIDVNRSLGFKCRRFNKDIANTRFVSKKDDFEAKKEAMTGVYDNFYQTILKAKRLGVPHMKILKTLKENGLSTKRANALMKGRYQGIIDRSISRSKIKYKKKLIKKGD